MRSWRISAASRVSSPPFPGRFFYLYVIFSLLMIIKNPAGRQGFFLSKKAFLKRELGTYGSTVRKF